MARKKVLIFSLAYFPKHVGGAEVSIKEITNRIPDIDFHLITNRFDSTLPKEEKIGNVCVHRIGIVTKNPTMASLKKFPLALNKPLYQFLAAWKAHQLHAKLHFDVMWAVMAHSTGVPAAITKMLHPDLGYVLNLQEGDTIEHIERTMLPLWPLFTRAFTKADIVQPLSTFLANWARARGFRGPIEIIPNAVATNHFSQSYSEAELDAARTKLGKNPGDVFLVTTSRLVTKNAVDDVIKALQHLPDNVHFVVFGTGPDGGMLKELISKLGLEKRVHMEGHIGHKDMPLMLKACDIFIRPSRSEGFGSSFVEAMAAGLPVIATQEGGLADFLFDPVRNRTGVQAPFEGTHGQIISNGVDEKRNPDTSTTGWAVDKDSPEQIAIAVKDIIARPEKVKEVVATAKKMVFEKYDWDTIAQEMRENVFQKLFA